MFRRENGTVYGVINDFDLAWMEGRVCKGHKGEWTGTRPFMAISLHLDESQTQIPDHIERFDLESILYVMYWDARLSNKVESRATEKAKETYEEWTGKNDKSLISEKSRILHAMNGGYLNESYLPLYRTWLNPLSDLFAKGYSELFRYRKGWKAKHRGSMVPVDWELSGFDYYTLGGDVTFKKSGRL